MYDSIYIYSMYTNVYKCVYKHLSVYIYLIYTIENRESPANMYTNTA